MPSRGRPHRAAPHAARRPQPAGARPVFRSEAPALEDATGSVKIEARDITGLDPDADRSISSRQTRGAEPMNQPGAWKPWFPVIDYDRCTNCMQCLSFCLFGVYGVERRRQDPGAEQRQLQNQLPRLLARLPGGGDHVPEIQGRARSTATW